MFGWVKRLFGGTRTEAETLAALTEAETARRERAEAAAAAIRENSERKARKEPSVAAKKKKDPMRGIEAAWSNPKKGTVTTRVYREDGVSTFELEYNPDREAVTPGHYRTLRNGKSAWVDAFVRVKPKAAKRSAAAKAAAKKRKAKTNGKAKPTAADRVRDRRKTAKAKAE